MQNAREKKKINPSTERESEKKTHIEKKEVTAQKFAVSFFDQGCNKFGQE